MSRRCIVMDCGQAVHGRGLCSMHYNRWRRTGTPHSVGWGYQTDGLGICECSISRPNPKCCTVCGYPCIHRMAPRIRDRAIAKMPSLADQVVLGLERGAA